jgi:hypothetical protein
MLDAGAIESVNRRASESKMKLCAHLCALAATTLLGACNATTVNLYPARGSWALETPLPIITASIEGVGGPSGRITMTMPDQETCSGQWSAVPFPPGTTSLWDQYSLVAGFSHIPGRPGGTRSESSLSCARGTTVQAEFFTEGRQGFGVATDSRGNIYRILF